MYLRVRVCIIYIAYCSRLVGCLNLGSHANQFIPLCSIWTRVCQIMGGKLVLILPLTQHSCDLTVDNIIFFIFLFFYEVGGRPSMLHYQNKNKKIFLPLFVMGTLIWLISLSLDYNGMNQFQKINHNLEDYIIAVKIEVFNVYNQRVALFHILFISQYIPSNELGQIWGKKKQ